MRFRWLGTAGFEFSSGGAHLLVDPYLTRNPRSYPRQDLAPEDLSPAEAILVTHGHFDHVYDVPSIARAGECRVFASPMVCQKLYEKGLDGESLEAVEGYSSYEIGPFRVQAVPSRHVVFDVALVARTALRCLPHLKSLAGKGTAYYPAGDVYGYFIEVEGRSLYHIGSAWLNPEDMEDWEVDMFFVPVQGRSDITDLAAQIAAELKPRIVVPHHHDDFYPPLSRYIDLEPFKQSLYGLMPRVRMITPSINQWVEI